MSIVYDQDNNKSFHQLVNDEFNKFDNINLFINRTVEYQKVGRYQNLEEAIEKDIEIKNILNKYNVSFTEVNVTDDITDSILS